MLIFYAPLAWPLVCFGSFIYCRDLFEFPTVGSIRETFYCALTVRWVSFFPRSRSREMLPLKATAAFACFSAKKEALSKARAVIFLQDIPPQTLICLSFRSCVSIQPKEGKDFSFLKHRNMRVGWRMIFACLLD